MLLHSITITTSARATRPTAWRSWPQPIANGNLINRRWQARVVVVQADVLTCRATHAAAGAARDECLEAAAVRVLVSSCAALFEKFSGRARERIQRSIIPYFCNRRLGAYLFYRLPGRVLRTSFRTQF